MRNVKRRALVAAKAAIIIVLLLVVSWFAFRDLILGKIIQKIQHKFQTEYDSNLTIKTAGFRGVGGLDMEEVSLVPHTGDTLLYMKRISSDIGLMQLLAGNIQLQRLNMSGGYLQLVIRDSIKNYDAFVRKQSDSLPQKNSERKNYAREAYKILTTVLNLVPTEMSLSQVAFRIDDSGKKASVSLDKLSLVDSQMDSQIRVKTNKFSQTWRIHGTAAPRDRVADLRFFNLGEGPIKVPFLDERYNLKSSFDSIRIRLDKLDMSGGELTVKGLASIKELVVNHAKIATDDVEISDATFDYNFVFGSDFIRIDSSSTARLNKLTVHPFAEYSVKSDTLYRLKIKIPKMPAQEFINSLPRGLFTNLEGMGAEGDFDFRLDFEYNKNQPTDIILDSKLNKYGLKITQFGEANLAMINGPFVYRAIENGRQQRAIAVSPGSSSYTPLYQISPLLRQSVLTSEDPSFFSHKGFINEAFKQSIIKNIKTKKFARGASTISMQLVKNVFLTRDKTLSRKLEEILLVFILENNRIVSKERMLEVYFNIIEWGPNVYGVGEASNFYFQKHPSELTLRESLFLASIIPSPKRFMWQFNDQGELRSPYQHHQDRLTRLMFQRGLLKPEDTMYQIKKIMISGPARRHIRVKSEDIISPDPEMEEFDF
jgi:hypothetical protein